jgi:hypothetical protein
MTPEVERPEGASSAGRRTIASYSSYDEAEKAVDVLSDRDFPVERVAIVGSGLRYVEQVAGRLTTSRAGLMGAGQGAMIGLFFALLFGIFFTVDETFIWVLVYGLIAGALFGAIFGAIGHAATGGRRDFASVAGMQADSYELQVDADVADRAASLLREAGESIVPR